MSEETKRKSKVKVFFKGIKSEFKKIIWPDRNDVVKKTTAIVIVTIVVGIIISLLDTVVKYGMDKMFNL